MRVFRRGKLDYPEAEDEAHCLFVGSKAFEKAADWHARPDDFGAPDVVRSRLKTLPENGYVYVYTNDVPGFAERILPEVTRPFTLVSGQRDTPVRSETLGAAPIAALTGHPLLRHWHVQNLAMRHDRLSDLALGLDYHSLTEGRMAFWGPAASPLVQEAVLLERRRLGPRLEDRRTKGFSNWHFARNRGDRPDAYRTLTRQVNHYQLRRAKRRTSWTRNQKYFFTISPAGVGMDCHRTWEAILLGSAPIVPDQPINGLFSDLPVVVVRGWHEVTPALLARERERILEETFDFAPVLLRHWLSRLRGGTGTSLKMRYQAFMDLDAGQLHEISAAI